ncbi:MAG: LytTR family DNA-binding domain-containing protein [Candidatus Cloacimonadales bacterium]|nr:LytTR family DNA-binding domain-containing protein [Candidatus Cloacimonadales bacterium]
MIYKAIMVEDEPIAMNKLEKLLADFKDKIEILEKAVNGLEAVEKINSLRPDLIFLDIQMPGLTGFQVLAQLEYLPLVIFTTAYDEHALQAFDSNTIDYLLKPISRQKLQKAIAKLEHFQQNPQWQKMMQNLIRDITQPAALRLAVHLNDRIIFIDPEEIYYLQADNKYTEIHLHHKKYLISKTLAELEKELGKKFLRLHRSSLVNRDYIGEILKLSSRKWVMKLTDKNGTELPISRDYRDRLL